MWLDVKLSCMIASSAMQDVGSFGIRIPVSVGVGLVLALA